MNMIIETHTVPELDASSNHVKRWTSHEIYLLTRYYGKVSCRTLAEQFPDRTMKAIQNKAYNLGLTTQGGVVPESDGERY